MQYSQVADILGGRKVLGRNLRTRMDFVELGGAGITIGPEASRHELLERRRDLLTHPERYVAQEVVPLSTHPTFDGSGLFPHHIDLRAFVHLRAEGPSVRAPVAPAALTRVAPIGSMVVNSSRGGGGKDTWVLGPPRGAGSDE